MTLRRWNQEMQQLQKLLSRPKPSSLKSEINLLYNETSNNNKKRPAKGNITVLLYAKAIVDSLICIADHPCHVQILGGEVPPAPTPPYLTMTHENTSPPPMHTERSSSS